CRRGTGAQQPVCSRKRPGSSRRAPKSAANGTKRRVMRPCATTMRQPSDPLAHFVVALPAEAKPLVAHYRLRRRIGEEAFAVFENDRISLTVSGLGKPATAAAVGYTHVLYGKHKHAVWLNVGVAGHRQAPLGSVWLG